MGARQADDNKQDKVHGIDIEPDETVVLVASPSRAAVWYRYLVTLGFYGVWRSRNVAVLTDRRLVIGKGIVRRTVRSIPLPNINDASYVRKLVFAYCEVAATVREFEAMARIGPLWARRARRFTEEVQARS